MNFFEVFFAFLFSLVLNAQSYTISQEAPVPVTDGCARIHNEFITKQKTNFSYTDVKDCYQSYPFDKDVASKTIDTLTDLIGGFYSFLDKAKEPPQPGFDFRPMDLIAELKLFRNKSYATLYDFTIDIIHLFNDLKDAHTIFASNCFETFVFYTNMTFYSVVDNGMQKIKVFNDTIDRSNIDCEVTHIDGQQAFQIIYEYANKSVNWSRDLGVRFNIALDHTYAKRSFAIRYEIPEKPDITYTLKCDNTNEFNVKRNWNAFTIRSVLNKFNDSKSYFDNICNPIKGSKQSVSSNHKHRKVTKIFDNVDGILAKQDQSVTTIRIVDQFVEFYKVQDFGVVKIITEQPNTSTTDETIAMFPKVIQGFKELVNTGIKKVIDDLV
ncbi:13321_t:CDS:2 [Dentiscutata heterogama]|uniref:13321_t:CDS:1 n=1 Tax=Dentiscutata heterogama TaxID=1316150 RepID=A0ACA9L854_9GLOM|nr:13321_t:CDS:2 [Dentiscutata heterogama]